MEYLKNLYDAYQSILKSLEGKCKIVKVDARQEAVSVLYEVMKIISKERISRDKETGEGVIRYR